MPISNNHLLIQTVALIIALVSLANVFFLVNAITDPNCDPRPPAEIQTTCASGEAIMQRFVRFNAIPTDEDGVLRYVATDVDTDQEVSFEDWIRIISGPAYSNLARDLTTVLKEVPYKGYRFETPGVSHETVSKARFEFALVDAPNLADFAAYPKPVYFAEHLSAASPMRGGDGQQSDLPAGCVFTNLGGDATLVAPTDWSPESSPSKYSSCYGHLANFVRGAPEQQILEMWKILGGVLHEKLLGSIEITSPSEPIWFSTAGTGVPYLHFRLESRPKYYHYDPFRKFISS